MATPAGRTSGGRVPNQPGPTGYWAQVQKGFKQYPKPGLKYLSKNVKPVKQLPKQEPRRKFSE